MNKPIWGKYIAAHIKEFEVILLSFGRLLNTIERILLSLKRLWLCVGGTSIAFFSSQRIDWSSLLTLFQP
ncbi:hypothetical protein L3V43_12225 [Pseudoalteromonas sp. L23]|uniref:hypothetical protein n=1 Tax=unclassified Pseudoalteromonas TaxID=194690 RepID=UPI001EEFC5A0|nr:MULTISPECIES: hypothetical protein [unclassified Pseudoalteromonas]MCF7514342.1 hypothetical protein [Pseudoalteromonas sp. L7]MCF7526419.1 hypothetical protein [Pseudoalteromonas sp. L23]MCG7553122.1 hypothetical protein [Pseudoalteromonas sp. Of11M-6]MCX2768152.1 hypothetical protein [Pseudoalteromonas sp. B530]